MHGSIDNNAEMQVLRQKLRDRGYFEKPTFEHLTVWIAHVLTGSAAIVVLYAASTWQLRAAALAVATFTFLCMATIGHTASHSGLSEKSFVNQLVLYFTYPFLLGLSARYWVKSHVIIHHPSPNRVGVDRDCDLRPLFALNEDHARTSSSLSRGYRRIQGLVLPLVLPFNGFGIQLQGWRTLLAELTSQRPRPRALADLACLFAHLAVFVVLPCLVFGPKVGLAIYAVRVVLIGIALFAILAPGHYPEQAACLGPGWDREDFAARQVLTTINFRTGFLGRLVCNGLEYQIEHHLFPTISHAHLPEVSLLVRDFCERTGLPYRRLSWSRAIWESYKVFFIPKVVQQGATRKVAPSEPEATVTTLTTTTRSSLPPENRVA